MNIYEKVNIIKQDLLKANLKKSGVNKFSNFNYYELADITPTIIKLCNDYKVLTHISFTDNCAKLEVINIEQPEECLIYESPMKDITIKGANEIQALGGVETYQRRYLYMMAFDIIENDMFDATAGMTDEDRANAYKFKSGKFKDMTIKEAYKFNKDHLQYLLDVGKSEEVKGYIELLTDLKRTTIPENEDEQKKRLELINKIVEQHGQKDLEQLKEDNHVQEIWQLTTEEMEALVKE